MNLVLSSIGNPAWKPVVLVSATMLFCNSPALAQMATTSEANKTLAPVVVSASRFASDPAFAPIGATVITADQIREAGIGNVNEAIRKIGGVYGRQNLYGTSDYSLDLRGFGDTGDQNVVVLLDGVRLSEKEQAGPLLSSIPIDLVERVEIVRGGSSVLYGEGATGGTIQIITKRPQRNQLRGSIAGEIGTYGHEALRAMVARDWNGFSLDATVSKQRADNYRANNASEQENFSGGMQWASAEGRVGMRIDIARADNRLAGPLTLAQFNADPRQTLRPNDFASYDLNRYSLFAERRIGAFDLAAELSHSDKTANLFEDYGGGYSNSSELKTRGTQFSPRLRHISGAGSWKNELVTGLDFAEWDQASSMNQADAAQESQAVYVQNKIQFKDNALLVFGARHENFDQDASGAFGNNYSKSFGLNAWDLQGSYAPLQGLRVFAKAGRSYRVANVDDNRYTDVPDQPLQPQTSRDAELGASFGNPERKLTVKWFEHRLKNEIMFDPPTFANINLEPTRRRGIELEGNVRLSKQFSALANFQSVRASFTDGINAGNEVPMVPRNTLSARLNWASGNGQSADIGAQWVSKQRYGNDLDNSCDAKMPSFVTFDARYAVRFQHWEFAVAGSNLTDRDYFSRAYGCKGNIYPDPGRQLKLTARYDF